MNLHSLSSAAAAAILAAALLPAGAASGPPTVQGDHVVLSWNDLGMHCMNLSHANASVLPPYNTLRAQVVRRGDAARAPLLLDAGVSLEYSIPGNTVSASKTDFWVHCEALFGVQLPPDIGLTGKGLAGTMEPRPGYFIAEGIPVTPFPDDAPSTPNPYQQALVIARDAEGAELARSEPVIPVSVEMNCVSSGCHSGELQFLFAHPREEGFDPDRRPILCAACHADPALGTPGNPEAGWFSFRMHDQHKFMDEEFSGTALCYRCHPGPATRCLRDVMAQEWGMQCQDCHGGMATVSHSIEAGRTPWLEEPSCGGCHGARFAEPAGQLFRASAGHGGLQCSACHGSPHAIYPAREPGDNEDMVALQGHAGTLRDCTVCHGVVPDSPGPHGMLVTQVAEQELAGRAEPLAVFPNPTSGACTFEIAWGEAEGGRLLLYDAEGRLVRLLRPEPAAGGGARAAWDGLGRGGRPAAPGVYFARWRQGSREGAARVLVAR